MEDINIINGPTLKFGSVQNVVNHKGVERINQKTRLAVTPPCVGPSTSLGKPSVTKNHPTATERGERGENSRSAKCPPLRTALRLDISVHLYSSINHLSISRYVCPDLSIYLFIHLSRSMIYLLMFYLFFIDLLTPQNQNSVKLPLCCVPV